MLTLENLLLFVPAMLLFVILPGPDFALVSRVSLLEGATQGKAAACGVAVGVVMHTACAIAGISAIIAASTRLFQLLRYAGAVYLFVLGIQAFRQNIEPLSEETVHTSAGPKCHKVSLRLAFRQGFLTNALNPKAILVFLTLLPQFMTPSASPAPQLLEMGAIIAALCLGWFLFLAQILGRVRQIFSRRHFRLWLNRLTGAVFIGFSLRLAFGGAD